MAIEIPEQVVVVSGRSGVAFPIPNVVGEQGFVRVLLGFFVDLGEVGLEVLDEGVVEVFTKKMSWLRVSMIKFWPKSIIGKKVEPKDVKSRLTAKGHGQLGYDNNWSSKLYLPPPRLWLLVNDPDPPAGFWAVQKLWMAV